MRRIVTEVLIAGLLFLLPLILFWPQTVGGRTLLPTENLYQYEPYATYREVVNAPAVPHNHLLSDLVLQNVQWKSLIRRNIEAGELPLWNPHQFSGIPFMAAGQQSTLYPLSILYYVLPLTAAYGWFTVANLWLAGVFMYLFLRGLGVARIGGVVAGITYQLCGFFIASVVFPMIIGAVVWLPLLLLMVEFVIQRRPLLGRPMAIPWVVIGAAALGCNILAGHVEITIYTLLIMGYYAAARLLWMLWQGRTTPSARRAAFQAALWLVGLVVLGLGLAAVQFIPLYEFVQTNWRAERSSLQAVLGFAHPFRDAIQFVMPNFYGSPAHHSYLDVFTWQRVNEFTNLAGEPINYIDWGIKNYVESALYLGILPLVLAAFALVEAWVMRSYKGESFSQPGTPPYRIIFAVLVLIALTFMFGLPTYAVIYVLPGINQLNSAFRWIFAVSAGVAVLAGFGADALRRVARTESAAARHASPMHYDEDGELRIRALRLGYALVFLGVVIITALLVSRFVLPGTIYPVISRVSQDIVQNAAKASEAFSGPRMFYSYQFPNVLVFGVMLLLSGVVFLIATRAGRGRRWHVAWQLVAVVMIATDLMIASWGFNPASDPALLDFTPPSIEWLLERQAEEPPFRYTTLDATQMHRALFQPNMTLRYGLDDIRGYDSIISRQYVDYMRDLTIQPQLDFNRIAPLYTDRLSEINWPYLDFLNVRYVITYQTTTLLQEMAGGENPRFTEVYTDEAVRIWRNNAAMPRAAIILPDAATGTDVPVDVPVDSIVGTTPASSDLLTNGVAGYDVTIASDTGREKTLTINLPDDEANGERIPWLFVSETYAPGWRAFIRPRGTDANAEREIDVQLIYENFQGVRLDPAALAAQFLDLAQNPDDSRTAEEIRAAIDGGEYTLRMVYSPTSFQVGLFGSVISAALLAFLLGVWLWQLLVGTSSAESATVSRVARNSIAPIVLNLFNRGIDFAFAFVMLRILGPEQAGIYYYAIVVFVWFDIFTNFGLDVFLIREVSRARERAAYFFVNTSAFRLFLMLACVPLLLGFMFLRQATISPPLTQEALIAIGLLYIGLAPGSLSKGLTSLYYAFERAEIPAAVTTITTINKAVLGLIALLLGYGIIGLAAVSIGVNVVTLGVLYWAGRRYLRTVEGQPTRLSTSMLRTMTREGWPLMLNHFLATIFFQIDIVILETLRGAEIVGKYSVSYRWLLALNIIPAFFTQALLPVMSRQASEDRPALRRSYTLGVKLLVAVAVPLAVAFTFMAPALTLFLGGAEFMPEGAIALQIMIWSIPIGWINSLTQYALIAVDLQRRITLAFAVAVSFNIITNLIFIPIYGYRAAAITTIMSEMVLLIPFGLLLQRALGRLNWVDMVWRPLTAGTAMLAVMVVSWPVQPILALMAGAVLYPAVLLVLRPLSREERGMLRPLLPGRLRAVLAR
ncbi:MAG: hypothetical protein OHK0046_50140 [Anaerolineae bacterium]